MEKVSVDLESPYIVSKTHFSIKSLANSRMCLQLMR